ncbi:hypothetical protein C0W35_21025 [Photobacterium kishitanii]|uniref:hypothetical protein n=1 Tax=Photobacterium kishitanii TaxID=318456 RepID=UPI000D17CBE9|nr:hypothetical protein [Photobacterium kishitanii]PSU87909.1 hypothetical protein C0W35_21025 [Photobacterium kishitanii]
MLTLSLNRNIFGDREEFRSELLKKSKEKATEHSDAIAQHELARYYEVGKGWFSYQAIEKKK